MTVDEQIGTEAIPPAISAAPVIATLAEQESSLEEGNPLKSQLQHWLKVLHNIETHLIQRTKEEFTKLWNS